jgi:hypothetical protein
MSAILGFVINAAGLFVPLGIDIAQALQRPTVGTNVQVIVGSGAGGGTDGNALHIALWDEDGNRIGQYNPQSKDKWDSGSVNNNFIEHTQTEPKNKQVDPAYVMLTNFDNDAICVAAITVANQKISSTFYGDTGVVCGQSWFLSDTLLGNNFQKPKCVWFDADHTNGINARGMSFHLNDMAPNTDKLQEYSDNRDTLCKSTPRWSIWGNILPDGIIPFFNPKLEYLDDSSGAGQGADKNPQAVIDKDGQYDKSVYLHQGEHKRMTKRTTRRKRVTPVGANHNPEHLIVTDHPGDSAREVCESTSSYGFDIISTSEGLFCDMQNKQLYQICDQDLADNCFNLDTKTLIPKTALTARGGYQNIAVRNYTTFAHWKV